MTALSVSLGGAKTEEFTEKNRDEEKTESLGKIGEGTCPPLRSLTSAWDLGPRE